MNSNINNEGCTVKNKNCIASFSVNVRTRRPVSLQFTVPVLAVKFVVRGFGIRIIVHVKPPAHNTQQHAPHDQNMEPQFGKNGSDLPRFHAN